MCEFVSSYKFSHPLFLILQYFTAVVEPVQKPARRKGQNNSDDNGKDDAKSNGDGNGKGQGNGDANGNSAANSTDTDNAATGAGPDAALLDPCSMRSRERRRALADVVVVKAMPLLNSKEEVFADWIAATAYDYQRRNVFRVKALL